MANTNNNKTLNVPNLRFPEFKGEWKKCCIKDFGTVITGNTPPTKNEEYYTNGIKLWASPADLGKDKYVIDTNTKLSQSGFERTRTLPIGSILVTCIGSTIGKMGMAKYEMSSNQQINSVIANDFTDRNFAYYAIQNAFPLYLSEVAVQAVPILSKSNFEKLPNCKPTLQEQRKLGKFIDLLDQRISTPNKIIEKLQSLIKGINDTIITLQCGQLVAFETIYSSAGEGGTPTTSIVEFYKDGNIPFIKIDDLNSKYLLTNKDYITELGLKKSSAWLVPTNSIIYSNGATIGAISINKYPVCTKQGIIGIVPIPNIDVEYLYYLMSSSYFQKEVERIVTEGTMKTAYLKDINHIKCPIPDLDKQKEIGQTLSALSHKEDLERLLLQKYRILKQYLLSQMFI